MTTFLHKPVLLRETMDILDLRPGLTVVDCTAGGGGHSLAMMERIMPAGRLVAIDQDPQAIEAAEAKLATAWAEMRRVDGQLSNPVSNPPYQLIHSNFVKIGDILDALGIHAIDRALMDLGVSSYQLDEGDRGFSYQRSGLLDMRMDPGSGAPTARDVVMNATAQELEQILWRYGEERWSMRIAAFIVSEREKAPIETADQLTAVIKKAIPAGAREEGPHPSRRTFQALRLHINQELEVLEEAVNEIVARLSTGGRLAIIDFHSLEDRIIKDTFRALAAGCTCPKDFPVCVCGKTSMGKALTAKPITPGAEEIADNPRSRSAKLRAFIRK